MYLVKSDKVRPAEACQAALRAVPEAELSPQNLAYLDQEAEDTSRIIELFSEALEEIALTTKERTTRDLAEDALALLHGS